MSNPTAVNRPSFFKPLINKFSTELRLPISFVRKHRNILPEKTKLRVRSGKIWNVEIDETEDDDECFFTKGWSDFVKDLELQEMQVLVFWLNAGDGIFDVAVYESDSNERRFSAVDLRGRSNNVVVESESEESGESESESDEISRPRFEFALTKSQKSKMVLPKVFAAATGLKGKRVVVLQYSARERYWAVVLDQRKPPQSTLDLTAGWNDFLVENKLVLGKNYSFEFNSAKNLILVSDCISASDSKDHTPLNKKHVLKFVREVKENHFKVHRMIIPREFGLSIGIAMDGDKIKLENSRGKKWPITITSLNGSTFAMTRGFIDFMRENNVKIGDVLLFESVANSVANVVKVVVMAKKAGKEMLARSIWGGMIES